MKLDNSEGPLRHTSLHPFPGEVKVTAKAAKALTHYSWADEVFKGVAWGDDVARASSFVSTCLQRVKQRLVDERT